MSHALCDSRGEAGKRLKGYVSCNCEQACKQQKGLQQSRMEQHRWIQSFSNGGKTIRQIPPDQEWDQNEQKQIVINRGRYA